MDLAINNWEDVDTLASDPGMQGSGPQKKDELQQLLRFLRFRQEVDLPVTVREGPDPPDFVLVSPTKTTGVEMTWAANKSWEESTAHLGKGNPGYVSRNWLETTPKLKGKDLGELIKRKQGSMLPTAGFVWHSSIWSPREHAAAKACEVVDAMKSKTEACRRANYPRFEQNWLLISDKNTFDLMEINEFRESALHLIDDQSVHHDAVYFVTRVRGQDVLFELSGSYCRVIAHVPSQ